MAEPGRLRFGVLGTGAIARTFTRELTESENCRVVAVASRTAEGAARFDAQGAPIGLRRHASYEALLADQDVDVVYIAIPHPSHARWAILAAEAGKHVLCEKPLALNHAEASAIAEAAGRSGVFLMEGFMYRHHPQVAEVARRLHAGSLGQVWLVEASFGFAAPEDPGGRLRSAELGGGAILDVGCYPASFARLVAVAAGFDSASPEQVTATGILSEEGIDLSTAATFRYAGGLMAQLSASVESRLENRAVIRGSEGTLVIEQPWLPAMTAELVTLLPDGSARRESISADRGTYALEADALARALRAGKRELEWPGMTIADSLANMHGLDRWRRAIKVEYPSERSAAARSPIRGRALAVRGETPMRYGSLTGVDKAISRLVIGVDKYPGSQDLSSCLAMMDEFFERGGNAFDTAHWYAGGMCERILGDWIRTRGVSKQVVVVAKAAHTPNCTPEGIAEELPESLERLGLDCVDVFMVHRDNPEVSVAEFSDAFEEQRALGRFNALGASNWETSRVAEFNQHASRIGRPGFALLSNNLSLARMVDPPWSGCVGSWDPASRDWLRTSGLALMPWSSQGRGFFTTRAKPEDTSDPELVRCWYSEDNFERLARARQLAAERGVSAVAVALAWVLGQPFATFPLIGPATVLEVADSMAALALSLSAEDVRWLESGDSGLVRRAGQDHRAARSG